MAKKINDNREAYEVSTFLGGTCGTSTWRKGLIGMFDEKVLYFDPQLPPGAWNKAAAKAEDACKQVAILNVFVVTGETLGTYSGWEIRDEAEKRGERLVLCFVGEIPENQQKGINRIKEGVKSFGGTVCETLEEVAEAVNGLYFELETKAEYLDYFYSLPGAEDDER